MKEKVIIFTEGLDILILLDLLMNNVRIVILSEAKDPRIPPPQATA
jgi:hypothetical protein